MRMAHTTQGERKKRKKEKKRKKKNEKEAFETSRLRQVVIQ